MKDRFEPHLVQAEYLHQVGFRDELIAQLRLAMGVVGPGYLFSEENEKARTAANAWLISILLAFGLVRSDAVVRIATDTGILKRVNAVVVRYSLGEPIALDEVMNK